MVPTLGAEDGDEDDDEGRALMGRKNRRIDHPRRHKHRQAVKLSALWLDHEPRATSPTSNAAEGVGGASHPMLGRPMGPEPRGESPSHYLGLNDAKTAETAAEGGL